MAGCCHSPLGMFAPLLGVELRLQPRFAVAVGGVTVVGGAGTADALTDEGQDFVCSVIVVISRGVRFKLTHRVVRI